MRFPKVVIALLAVIAFGLISNVLILTVQPAWASGSLHVYTVDENSLLVKAVDKTKNNGFLLSLFLSFGVFNAFSFLNSVDSITQHS